jgi:Secretion system C-terminal sorting domain
MFRQITLALMLNILFLITSQAQSCPDNRANFTIQGNPYYPCCANFTTNNYGGIFTYNDGSSPSKQGSHCFPSSGLYTVSYTYNGCTTSQTYNASGSGCSPITPCTLQAHFCGDSNYSYFYENNRWEFPLYIFERHSKQIVRDISLGGNHSNQWSYVRYDFNGWGLGTPTAKYSTDNDLTTEEYWFVTYNWNTGAWTNLSYRDVDICLTISNSQCANQICINDCEEGLIGGSEDVLALKKANNKAQDNEAQLSYKIYANFVERGSNFGLQLSNESMKEPQNSLEIIEAISKTMPPMNNKYAQNEFILYPNPIKSGSNLNIQLPFDNNKIGIKYVAKIIDVTGKMMSSTFIYTGLSNILTEGLTKGVYILAVSDENGEVKQRKKIVVN